ncbi:hypothetical protein Taro_053110 [Colocasia esculenta]|uniref:Protein kinase domain-containing protein n=1 Tax=Colocasia esculenta TaxID=4460 RepID=A0A843XLM2_COLES|nr:hypothetical protein [Colocasia esculenta]
MVMILPGVRAAHLRILLSFLLHFLALLQSTFSAAQTFESRTWIFSNFTDDFRENMTFHSDAGVAGGALQLTPDTRNDPERFLVNKSGRVIFRNPLKIWEDGARLPDPASNSSAVASPRGDGNLGNSTGWSQKTVISFSSTFVFNVYRASDWPNAGEGLAFIITGSNSIPPNSEGQYLGLTNAATDGNATNQFVAVEFDTNKQKYDPDGNHVGLDINSVVSKFTRSLSAFNIIIARQNGTDYRAWIDYNGTERHIYLYVALIDEPKPPTPALNASLDLSEHLPQYAYFGFSGSTGTKYELNCILAWNLTAEILPEDEDVSAWSWFLRVGVPILAVAVAAGLALLVYAHRRKARRDERLVGTLKSLPGMPREFQYKELKRATQNFNQTNRLGQGGFGVVYRGVIPGENVEVAVKTFSRETMQGDFLAELTIINRLRHKHLVRLLGEYPRTSTFITVNC